MKIVKLDSRSLSQFLLAQFLCLTFIFGEVASASALVWKGVLRERGTKKPISDANVFLLPQKLKVTSNANGQFEFENLPPGEYELVVNLTGYQKLEQKISVQLAEGENSLEVNNLYLEKEFYSGFETTVTARAQKRDDQQKSISQAEFLSAPGAGGDPIKAVQNLAGIARPQGANAQVVIQGAEPQDTRYSIDGHRVPLIFHFGGLSSIVFPEAVESVNLYPAGYGPEYGRALGGQITLETRDPKAERWQGVGFVDFLNMGGLIEGPIGEGQSLLVAGRYSYIGQIVKAAVESMPEGKDDFGLTVAPSFYDLTLIYKNKISDKNDLRITAVTSGDKIEFVLKEPPSGDAALRGRFFNETIFYRLIPQYRMILEDQSELNFSAGFGKNKITFDIGDNYFKLDANILTLRSEYIRQLNPIWKSFLGFENEYVWFNLGLRLPDFNNAGGVGSPPSVGSLRDTSLKDKSIDTALFWRNEVAVSEKWTLIPGLRLDSFRTTKETILQPKFAARYKFSESTSYRFASGIYHQPPSGQQSNKDFGNPDIKSSRAFHLNLGVDKDFREGASTGHQLAVGGFYKKLDSLVAQSTGRVERGGSSVPENFNNKAEGRIQGLETTWKYKEIDWSLGLAYTLSQSYRTEPGQKEYPAESDQTHNINLLGSYQTPRWLWTGRMRYVTGGPFTPVVGSYLDTDQDVYVPIRGDFYSERKKAFSQLDVRAERKVIYDTWILSYYLDIQNIFNQKNIEGVDYSYDFKQRQDVSGLGILPTFGVKGEF